MATTKKAPAKAGAKTPTKKAGAPPLAAVNGNSPGRGPVPPSENAMALYRFLREEWDRMGVYPTVWCRQHGIPDPTVMRWARGTEPDMRSIRRVATALGRSVLDLLVAGKYITPEEANGHIPTPVVVDARAAILSDPRISEFLAEAMLKLWDSYEEIEAGLAKRIESRTSPRGTRSKINRR